MDSVCVMVKVVPGASRDHVVGRHGQGLKIRVTVPAQRGQANQRAIELLAAAIGVKPSQISILRGISSPNKLMSIQGIGDSVLRQRLAKLR
jgi:uncharacterized protein (TIGR00251 family)